MGGCLIYFVLSIVFWCILCIHSANVTKPYFGKKEHRISVTRVLGVLERKPGFAHFMDLIPVLGCGSYSHFLRGLCHIYYYHSIISVISIYLSYLIYPIRGGLLYRGIYDVGLKGAFMGYRPFIECPLIG
jgi:hypothetical protein